MSLSLLLGQAIGENLLPIIPHIDDYACLICTNIAFKPIRLSCGHLFCVRYASPLATGSHIAYLTKDRLQMSREDAEEGARTLPDVPRPERPVCRSL